MNPAEKTALKLAAGMLALLLSLTSLSVASAACSPKDDGVSPRDCADRDNAEVCEP